MSARGGDGAGDGRIELGDLLRDAGRELRRSVAERPGRTLLLALAAGAAITLVPRHWLGRASGVTRAVVGPTLLAGLQTLVARSLASPRRSSPGRPEGESS